MMRLKRSKSFGRASIAFGVIVALCIHSGNAFRPSAQQVKLRAIPTSLHSRCPSLLIYQQQPLSARRPLNSAIYSSVSPNADSSDDDSPRSKLRQLTGFSLTALRSTLRAATGFSLTAFRATLRAATGISLSQSISGAIRHIMEILSPSLRYFLQPFLIMYYAPLLMVRYYMVGPSRQYVEESRKGHEKMVDGWRKAVEAAEKANAGGYWPVHLNDDGTITTSLPPDPNDVLDLTDGIEQSVAAATATSDKTLAP